MSIQTIRETVKGEAARPEALSAVAEVAADYARCRPRTLIADDQPHVLEALTLLLKREGHVTHTARSPVAVLRALENHEFDLVLMDLNYARDTTSGHEGLELLSRIRSLHSSLPVVVMTAWGNIDVAVEAMRRGVSDFVEKPWENARLLATLREQIEQGRARRRIATSTPAANPIDSELEAAGRIQRGFLPREIPPLGGFEMAGYWQPSRAVGGDSYDVLKLDEQHAGICIGDAVGKGLPAALLMLNVQATVRALASPCTPPAELCRRLNQSICGQVGASCFISFFFGLLDGARRQLEYAGAGHNPPILMRRDGSHLRLRAGGGLLGVAPDGLYRQGRVPLASGDRLVLFTDGVTEARDAEDEEFGETRLMDVVRGARHLDPAAINERIVMALGEFCPDGIQDDMTLLTVAVAGERMA